MEKTSTYSAQREAGREHFPLIPKWFLGIRILQLIVALTCLGLCAYGVSVTSSVGFALDGNALMLFTVRGHPDGSFGRWQVVMADSCNPHRPWQP
jgi:hypothetical protein